ncbi:MAG: response regulator [Patescibacteria group bacterium]
MWPKKDKPKILIVEDNESNHPLFRESFEQAGFDVIISQNADGEFAEDVAALKPDIISMDIMIGKLGVAIQRDGLQTIQLLKSRKETKHIPIIVMSSLYEEGKVRQAKALGAADFVNLQGHAITRVPDIFKKYLTHPDQYHPTHPIFREMK